MEPVLMCQCIATGGQQRGHANPLFNARARKRNTARDGAAGVDGQGMRHEESLQNWGCGAVSVHGEKRRTVKSLYFAVNTPGQWRPFLLHAINTLCPT